MTKIQNSLPLPDKRKSKDKNSNSRYFLLALFLFGSSLFFLFMALNSGDSESSTSDTIASQPTQEDINYNMKTAFQKRELEKLRFQQENATDTSPQKADLRPKYLAPEETLSLDYDDRSTEIAHDLKGLTGKQYDQTNSSDVIQTEIYEKQMSHQINEVYKKEYARQFVENAKRKGYDIKLSSDYRILSVRKITQKQNINLRDLSSSGSK